MLTLFLSDLQRKLKKPMTWFMIIILCTLTGLNMMEVQQEKNTRPFIEHNVVGFNSLYSWAKYMDEKEKVAYPTVLASMELIDQINKDAEKAITEKNYREMTRLNSFYSLAALKQSRLSLDPVGDVLLKKEIYDLWLDVSNGVTYDSVDFRPVKIGAKTYANENLLSGKYHHNLYMNEIKPIYNDEANNLTTLYGYFFKVVPIMVFLVIILFSYNNINNDKNTGVLKLVLTQTVGRSTYYISKWISSVVHILIVFLIPPIFMSILGGIMGGFVTLKYPTFYLSNIFTRFAPIPNYFDRVAKEFRAPELHSRIFGHIAPEFYGYTATVNPHSDVDIIPFYQYLLIVIGLLVLFIMFAVALVQLISALIDHEIISLVSVSALIGLMTYISLPFTQEKAYNFSPFTFFRVSRIVEGTNNVTVLTSILVMIVSVSILLTSGCMYFKKKTI